MGLLSKVKVIGISVCNLPIICGSTSEISDFRSVKKTHKTIKIIGTLGEIGPKSPRISCTAR